MDFYVGMAVSVLLQVLTDRKLLVKWAPAFAKVFVSIKRAAELNPTLAGEIAKREQ